MNEERTYQIRAEECWGPELPDWVGILATQADATSQNRCAKDLGISVSQVSQIIACKYAGRLDTAEIRVRGIYMKETISCPSLGELRKSDCLDWRLKADDFSSHNALRVRMFRACRNCPSNPEAHS